MAPIERKPASTVGDQSFDLLTDSEEDDLLDASAEAVIVTEDE